MRVQTEQNLPSMRRLEVLLWMPGTTRVQHAVIIPMETELLNTTVVLVVNGMNEGEPRSEIICPRLRLRLRLQANGAELYAFPGETIPRCSVRPNTRFTDNGVNC